MTNAPESWNFGFSSGIEEEPEQPWSKKKAEKILSLFQKLSAITPNKAYSQRLKTVLEKYSLTKNISIEEMRQRLMNLELTIKSDRYPDWISPMESEELLNELIGE